MDWSHSDRERIVEHYVRVLELQEQVRQMKIIRSQKDPNNQNITEHIQYVRGFIDMLKDRPKEEMGSLGEVTAAKRIMSIGLSVSRTI